MTLDISPSIIFSLMKHNHTIKGYLIAGLLVWLPILVTVLVLRSILELVDKTLALLPDHLHPAVLFGFNIPGLGLVFAFLILFGTGIIVTNFLGRRIVHLAEKILDKIPLVRTIYKSTKQVVTTIFSSNSDSFRNVVLIEYPRKGVWSIAFQTGSGKSKVNASSDEELITVFIPTTPNPTSGFLLLVPKSQAVDLEMSIDEALKMVISLGVVQPQQSPETHQLG